MVSANPPAGPYLAELNFAVEESAPGAFEFPFVFRHPSGKPLYLAPHTVPIHDLRQQIRPPSLDREGFTWLSLPYDDLEGPDGWEDRYAEATCAWLMKHLGAKACKPINHQLRRRTPEGKPSANYTQPDRTQGGQPVPAVHVDINRERASARVLTPFEGSEFSAETNRLAIFNIWRPLKGPIVDVPLAMLDAQTLDPADMKRTTDKFGGGYFIQYNENMRWMYIRDQMPDEVFIFRQFDSSIPYSGPGCVAHTAFIDKERYANCPNPRSSIEVRCAVIY